MEKLDEDTVHEIQFTSPGACERQARHLYAKVNSGQIFSAFSDTERNRIWLRLCSATENCLVPSLLAFFENLKYLQPAAVCMRRLVHLDKGESIRCALEKAFSPDDGDECVMQTSSISFTTIPISAADCFDIAYRQLWLYALREHRDMPMKRKEKLAMAKTGQADEVVVFRFACLAQKLGFKSDEIEALVQMNPDQEIARRLLTTARKPEEFEFDDINASIDTVADVLATARPISAQLLTEDDEIDTVEKPPALCGQPHAADHARDKKDMFLDKLHGPMPRPRLRLTSIFIQRSAYFALFGQDLGISVGGLESTEDTHMLDHSSSHEQRLPLNVAERRTSTQRSTEEQEARLAQLAATERQLSRHVEQLKSDTALQERKIQTLKIEEQEALRRLSGLQRTETEQTLRLEALKADEQNRQREIVVLEQRRDNLGDQIRLDLLGPGEKERPSTVERDGAFPDHHASSRPEQVSLVEDLAAKKERLRAVVEQLTLQMAQLDEEKAGKVASMTAVEEKHRSTIDQLIAEEVALRNQIDQLKTYLAQLEARLDDSTGRTTELEEERSASVERRSPSPPLALSSDLPGTATNEGLVTPEIYGGTTGRQMKGIDLEHVVREGLYTHDEISDSASTQLGQTVRYRSFSQDDLQLEEETHQAVEYCSQVSLSSHHLGWRKV